MKRLFLVSSLVFSLFVAQPALAIVLDDGHLEEAGRNATYTTSQSLEDTIGILISVVLGLLGVIFLILTLYAGFLWMTSAGDSKKVDQAKQILTTSVIGLVIILAAYAITEFVLRVLLTAVDGAAPG